MDDVVEAVLKTSIGKKVLSYLIANAIEATPLPNPSQSGQAGAVPAPDTAPLTGGPHEDTSIENTSIPELHYVNDWDATNFHMVTTGTIADVANSDMRDFFGSNGTSYSNSLR